MITINDIEILTVQDGIKWSGSKDEVARTFTFGYIYAPNDDKFPVYNAKVGDRVKWIENDKTLFYGYIESLDYTTDGDIINVNCIDLSIRLLKSKSIGRFKGTLNEITDRICSLFNLNNAIKINNSHIHNIVSDGDLSYYDVINTACHTLFERYCIFLDGLTLKLVDHNVRNTFEIKKNIRMSSFSSNMDDLVNSVLIIDNDGKLLETIQDPDSIAKFGLFQEVYNYNKDIKDNRAEAKKLLKNVENKAEITVDNDNNIISGCFIKIYEPINGFIGTFEVLTDNHTIGADSSMQLEVQYVG